MKLPAETSRLLEEVGSLVIDGRLVVAPKKAEKPKAAPAAETEKEVNE